MAYRQQKKGASKKSKSDGHFPSTAADDHVVVVPSPAKMMQQISVRLTYTSSISLNGGVNFSWSRSPVSCPAWSSYASEYDQFKVNSMRITLCFPHEGIVAASGSATGVYPKVIVLCYDNDQSSSFVTTVAAAFDYATAATSSCEGLVSYYIPKLPPCMIYTGGIGGNNVSSEWVDCANPAACLGMIGGVINAAVSSTTTDLNTAPYLLEYNVTFRGKR